MPGFKDHFEAAFNHLSQTPINQIKRIQYQEYQHSEFADPTAARGFDVTPLTDKPTWVPYPVHASAIFRPSLPREVLQNADLYRKRMW